MDLCATAIANAVLGRNTRGMLILYNAFDLYIFSFHTTANLLLSHRSTGSISLWKELSTNGLGVSQLSPNLF